MKNNGKPKQAIMEVLLTVVAVLLIITIGLITAQYIADTWVPDPPELASHTVGDMEELSNV